ncbi:MAG: RHS repeat domain-containing protein [Desulfovibrio sp.]
MRSQEFYDAGAPYRLHLEFDDDGRIVHRVEHVRGNARRELWYTYSGDKLQAVRAQAGAASLALEMYQYNNQDQRVESWHSGIGAAQSNMRYAYSGDRLLAVDNDHIQRDEHGFRHLRMRGDDIVERYRYAPDYRLLRVEQPGMTIDFDHDEHGQRVAKYVNGQLTERYHWHDMVRMDAAAMNGVPVDFLYIRDDDLRPSMMMYGEDFYRLYYDQVGSLRVVADEAGNVVKEVLYDSFGRILSDTNPAMHVPLGFGFGLHDRDTGWVRMGWRDYDPETGRFTALDPIGYAGGDSDLYGYCVDDPVNLTDPEGLKGGLWGGMKKIGTGFGELWENAPAGIGEAVSKGVKGAGEAFGKLGHEYATNKGLQKYTGIALGAGLAPIAAATAPEWVPAAVTATAPYVGKAAKGAKKAADAVAKGYNYLDKAVGKAAEPIAAKVGPTVMQNGIEVVGDLANPMPPAQTNLGRVASGYDYVKKNYEYYKDKFKEKSQKNGSEQPCLDDYWGR